MKMMIKRNFMKIYSIVNENIYGTMTLDKRIGRNVFMLYLLFVSVALATVNNLLLHGFDNRGLKGMGDVLFFNALISCVWIVISFVLNRTAVSIGSIMWGALYGTVTAVFLLSKMQAMASGPVSVTSFIGCSSLLISTAFGVLFFHESVTVVQVICLVLLIAALFLCISPKGGKAKPMWKFWCALFFLASGGVGLIFKLHQASEFAAEVDAMMLAASVMSFVIFAVSSVIVSKKRNSCFPHVPKIAVPYIIASGTVSFSYNKLNIMLSGKLPSIIFFPTFNGSVIIFASLLAAIIFKERLEKKQFIGIVLGTISVVASAGVIEQIIKLF